MNTPEPKAISVNDKILNAAAHCFQQEGVSKTNMANVANAAGMARSTLYRYFKDRDELIISVIEREAIILTKKIMPVIEKTSSMQDFVLDGTLMALTEIEINPILSSLVSVHTASSQHLLLATDRLSRIAIQVMAPAFEQAQQEGLVRESLAIEQVIDWILRIIISVLTLPSDAISTPAHKRDLLKNMLLPAIFKM